MTLQQEIEQIWYNIGRDLHYGGILSGIALWDYIDSQILREMNS